MAPHVNEPKETAPSASEGVGESRTAVARNAVFLVAGQVATTALAILLSAALGRSLGASDFGVYFLVMTMSGFALVIAEWGQPLFVIREVARHPSLAGSLLGTSLVMRIVGAALVAAPVGLLASALGYDARTCWFSVLGVASMLPIFLAQAYGTVFRGRDRMGLDAAVSVSNKVLGLLVTLAALSLGTGVPGVIVAQGIAGLGALAVAARLYRRLGAGPLGCTREMTRFVVVGGAPIVAMTVAVQLQPYLDIVILSKLAPAASVGWYGAAKNVMGTLLAPSIILATASYPRISRAAHEPALLRREMRAAMRPMLWLGALAGVGTYLFADEVIGLIYGAKAFGPAGTILKVFGPTLFLLFIDVLLGHVITATGKATGFAVAKFVSIAASTGLNFLLIPLFQERMGNGGLGVVVAFAASEIVVFAGALWLIPRGSLDLAVAADVGRSVASAAATGLLFHLLPPMSPFLGVPLCVAAFTLFSVPLGLVGRGDLELLRALLRRGDRGSGPA
jgi:O-antigen/teichoic acid export membrane protein